MKTIELPAEFDPSLPTDDLKIAYQVVQELRSATRHFRPFNSAHEGYSVILEECDELWDVIKLAKRDTLSLSSMREEAIQVAAMAIRFVRDVIDRP
jgi:hypothetical protein